MFNSSIESRREILQRVMDSKREFSVDLIEEFCEDFQFNLNDCLMLYLEVLLKKWNPTLSTVNVNGIKGKLLNQKLISRRIKKTIMTMIKNVFRIEN